MVKNKNRKENNMTRKEEIQQNANEYVKGADKFHGYKYGIEDVEYGYLAGAEWADRTMLEKLDKAIEKLLSGYIIRNFYFGDSYDIDKFVEDFKNYMKGE